MQLWKWKFGKKTKTERSRLSYQEIRDSWGGGLFSPSADNRTEPVRSCRLTGCFNGNFRFLFSQEPRDHRLVFHGKSFTADEFFTTQLKMEMMAPQWCDSFCLPCSIGQIASIVLIIVPNCNFDWCWCSRVCIMSEATCCCCSCKKKKRHFISSRMQSSVIHDEIASRFKESKFRFDLILYTLLSAFKCQAAEYADQCMKVLINIMSLSPRD